MIRRLSEKIRKTSFHSSPLYAGLVLAVMAAAYGIMMPRVGFFWDDWQAVYLAHDHSVQTYWQYYLSDRPFSIWTYLVTMPVLGIRPLAWQIFTLLVRWAGVLVFVATFSRIWPGRVWQVRWMGVLLAVFPGFTQQLIPVAYSQHFLTYLFFLLSLYFMVLAVQSSRRRVLFTITAVILAIIHLLTMEYFVGLELLRPLILLILLKDEGQKRWEAVRKAFLTWLPYLLPLLLFLILRLSILPLILTGTDSNDPYLLSQMVQQPIQTMLLLTQSAIQDFLELTLHVWTVNVEPTSVEFSRPVFFIAWAVGFITALILIGYNRFSGPYAKHNRTENKAFHLQTFVIGVGGFLLGALPVLLTDRQVIEGMWSDRFSLAPMLGAVILTVTFIDWLSDSRHRKGIFFSLLTCLAIAGHIQNANVYRNYWGIQRDYYWQLYWRAPELEPGTTVIGPEMPFGLVADYSIAFALNIIYGGSAPANDPQYWFMDGGRYAGGERLPEIAPDSPISYPLRNIQYEGNTSQAIVVSYDPSRRYCLRVFDPLFRDAIPLSPGDETVWPLANTDPIGPGDGEMNRTIAQLFSPEPRHTWCYYFQKAQLARQLGEWERVIELFNEAERLGHKPQDAVEWMPLVDAYAALERWEEAEQVSDEIFTVSAISTPVICEFWDHDNIPAELRNELEDKYDCENN